jgi:hypothetical protein
VKMVLPYEIITLNEVNTCVALIELLRGGNPEHLSAVRPLSYSVFTTVMDQKQQLLKPLKTNVSCIPRSRTNTEVCVLITLRKIIEL